MAQPSSFDEMLAPDGAARPAYERLARWLERLPPDRLRQKHDEASMLFRRLGITFLVHGAEGGSERLIPFDVVPRIFADDEWRLLSEGSVQRVRALNMFLDDLPVTRRDWDRGEILPALCGECRSVVRLLQQTLGLLETLCDSQPS